MQCKPRGTHRNFNSIKVRLKLLSTVTVNLQDEFQFHKGTIKTAVPLPVDEAQSRFQFHKGTIKTQISTTF